MEAVFVGLLLVTSVAIVSSMSTRPPSLPPERANLQTIVEDFLQGLEDLPTFDSFEFLMQKAVMQSYLGNTTALDVLSDRVLPEGCECRLWIDNGFRRVQLDGPPEKSSRQSVSAARLYHPGWDYAVAVPSLEVIHSSQPLDIQGYAVSQGALVKEQGIPVKVTVTSDLGVYDGAAITALRDGATTSLYMLNESAAPSFTYQDKVVQQSVYTDETEGGTLDPVGSFLLGAGFDNITVDLNLVRNTLGAYTLTLTDPLGKAYPFADVCSGHCHDGGVLPAAAGLWTLSFSAAGFYKKANLEVQAIKNTTQTQTNWTFMVRHEAGKALAEGTNLTLRFPFEFTGLELTKTAQAGWRNVAWHTSFAEGSWVSAELASPLKNASRPFVVHAKRPADNEAMWLVRGDLSNGTTGAASFVLGNPFGLTRTVNPLVHQPYVTVPKPVAPGSNSTWGLVLPYPSTTNAGAVENITQIDLRVADGRSLFGAVQGLVPSTGWTRVAPDHLRWTGSVHLLPASAVTFAARVTSAASGESSDEDPHRLPVKFGSGSSFRLGDAQSPFVFRGSIPPSSTYGYEQPAKEGVLAKGSTNLTVDWYTRAAHINSSMEYVVSDFPPLGTLTETLRVGLARSHLNITNTTLRPGGVSDVAVDFQGLYNQLQAKLGSVALWNVTVSVFDPAQPFQLRAAWTPMFRGNTSGQAFQADPANPWQLIGSAVSGAGRVNLTFKPSGTVFFGPHAVLAEASFQVKDASGNAMLETARLLGVIDVLPDGGQAETALYWVSMECWLPDW